MPRKPAGESAIRDEAVFAATGRSWAEWFRRLDRWGAATRTHREIAAHLLREEGVSAWWSQTVTVRYEQKRGFRVPGQRAGGKFEVTASRTVAAPVEDAFRAFTDPKLLSRWLGPSARASARAGGRFSTASGDRGAFLLVERPSRLRLAWEHPGLSPGTKVDVEFAPASGGRAVIRLTHRGLGTKREYEALRTRWAGALDTCRALWDPPGAPERTKKTQRRTGTMALKTGAKAPDFTLPDQDGNEHTLSQYRGKWVLLYFYPKDDTPGCTTEACGLRDGQAQYKRQGIVVLGVSPDSVKSHAKFAGKFDLPFTLLADTEKKVVQLYGVWGEKKYMGREYMGVNRWSFLIDPEGKIAKIYDKVKPAEHAGEVLADKKALTRAS